MSHLLGLFVDKWLNIVANRTWTTLPIWPHNWFRLYLFLTCPTSHFWPCLIFLEYESEVAILDTSAQGKARIGVMPPISAEESPEAHIESAEQCVVELRNAK